MEGAAVPVTLLNNYPDSTATGIAAAVNSNNGANGDFTFTAGAGAGAATWTKNGAPDARDLLGQLPPAAVGLDAHRHDLNGRLLARAPYPPGRIPAWEGTHMRRRASHRIPAFRPEGYTLVELVVVMAVAGVMAAYIAPRFWNQQSFSDRGYVDELAAALRATQKAAVITGCPAQLTLTSTSYAATQQAASGNSCNLADTTWPTPVLSADGSPVAGYRAGEHHREPDRRLPIQHAGRHELGSRLDHHRGHAYDHDRCRHRARAGAVAMRHRHRGVTLIEMVVAITIVAVAATTILGAIGAIATSSADAMMQQQAIAIAQAYLDEILQRWVVDPNGTPPNTGRGSWDLVDEYNGLVDVGAHDQFGNPIASLAAYTVGVTTSQSSALTGVPAAAARRVDITVSYSPNHSVTLSGYRTNY